MSDLNVNNNLKHFNLPTYIQIPYFVYTDKTLSDKEKMLFGHLYSYYTSGKTIRASNDYYAAILGIDPRSVRRLLDNLEDKKWILRIQSTSSPNHSKRKITILKKGEADIEHIDDSLENKGGHLCPPGEDTSVPPVRTLASSNIQVDTQVNKTTTTCPNGQTVIPHDQTITPPRSTDPNHISSLISVDPDTVSRSAINDSKRKMIEDVDLNPLRKLDFPTRALEELQRLYSPRPDILEESISHLTFDVDVNKKADHIDLDIVNFFMKIMRKGAGYGAPRGFKKRGAMAPKTKTPNPQDDIDSRKLQKLESFTSKQREQWKAKHLTDELMEQILTMPENMIKIEKQTFGKKGLKATLCNSYFNNEILPGLIAQHDDSELLEAWLMKSKLTVSI